jgi:hypothetical protein
VHNYIISKRKDINLVEWFMKNKGLEMCTLLCATLKIPVWLWKTPEINVFTKLNCRWTTTVPVKENVNIWLALFEWYIINSLISFYCMRSSWLKMCTPPVPSWKSRFGLRNPTHTKTHSCLNNWWHSYTNKIYIV